MGAGYGVWYQGGVYRVGTWEGYTGTSPSQPALLEETPRQRSGPPEALQGLEWGGLGVGRTGGSVGGSCTTLRARSVPVGPPCTGPLETPPPGHRGEIPPHFL